MPGVLSAGSRIRCEVEAEDPEGDPLTIRWELRPDVADNPNVGGDYEPPVDPIDGTVISSQGANAEVAFPAQPGKYRLFVYVHDGHGGATANVPILVQDNP